MTWGTLYSLTPTQFEVICAYYRLITSVPSESSPTLYQNTLLGYACTLTS